MGVELGAEPGSEFRQLTQTQHAGGVSGAHWWNGTSAEAKRDELHVRFGEFEVPLAPVLKPSTTVVVLGRNDFLASFRLTVDQRAETFSLEPYEEPVSAWVPRTRPAPATRKR